MRYGGIHTNAGKWFPVQAEIRAISGGHCLQTIVPNHRDGAIGMKTYSGS